MQFENSTIQLYAYIFLAVFAVIILLGCFSIKYNILNTMYANRNINAYNTGEYQLNIKEGFDFGGSKKKKKSYKMIVWMNV